MGKHTYYYTYDCWAQAQDMPAGYGGHIIDSLVSRAVEIPCSQVARASLQMNIMHTAEPCFAVRVLSPSAGRLRPGGQTMSGPNLIGFALFLIFSYFLS